MSSIDIGINPAKEAKDAVYAGMYHFNLKGYDLQFLGGYYHERLAIGGGFAGNLWTSAIKGEVTYFGENDTINESLSAAFDFQYGFSSS